MTGGGHHAEQHPHELLVRHHPGRDGDADAQAAEPGGHGDGQAAGGGVGERGRHVDVQVRVEAAHCQGEDDEDGETVGGHPPGDGPLEDHAAKGGSRHVVHAVHQGGVAQDLDLLHHPVRVVRLERGHVLHAHGLAVGQVQGARILLRPLAAQVQGQRLQGILVAHHQHILPRVRQRLHPLLVELGHPGVHLAQGLRRGGLLHARGGQALKHLAAVCHAQQVDVLAGKHAEGLLTQPVVQLVRQRALRVTLLNDQGTRLAGSPHVADEDAVKLDALLLDILPVWGVAAPQGVRWRRREGSSLVLSKPQGGATAAPHTMPARRACSSP